jgi:hypothetical protein
MGERDVATAVGIRRVGGAGAEFARAGGSRFGREQSPLDGLAGCDAVSRRAWPEAYDHLTAADASGGLSPEDLEGLAQAAWWTGQLADCIAARERAYVAHLDAGNRRRAGAAALELARDYYGRQDASVATAWFKRAERFLQEEPDSVEHGYLTRMRGVIAFEGQHDLETALTHAERVLTIGTRFGDRDLMALALQDKGRILVAKGQVADGMALMDEATMAAVSGELGPLATGIIYCNIIAACEGIADYRRAGEWTEAAKRWCERQAIAGFPGLCRVHRAAIMRVRGAWTEAEQDAQRACEELRGFNLNHAAAGFYGGLRPPVAPAARGPRLQPGRAGGRASGVIARRPARGRARPSRRVLRIRACRCAGVAAPPTSSCPGRSC